jgi:5-methyltetrahydropteroyltriglutamate--homocysteine methyltransferase
MLLPTSVVGSHGLPGWEWLAREAMEAGRLGAIDVRELMEDATQVALLDQERAGIDVVSTGEMMRVRFIIGFYDRFTGIRTLPAARRLGQPLWDTNTPFEVFERIQRARRTRHRGRVQARALADAKAHQGHVPGPYTLLVPLKLGAAYRDKDTLLADLLGSSAPSVGGWSGGRRLHPDRRAAQRDVFGRAAAVRRGREPGGRGIEANRGARLLRQPLRPAFSPCATSRISIRPCATSAPLRSFSSSPTAAWRTSILEGVPDRQGARRRRDRRQGVQERVGGRRGRPNPRDAEVCGARKLWLNPDCGFWETPRWVVKQKLAALVEGAAIVRKELGG